MGPPHLFEALPGGTPPQGRLATLQSLSGTGSLRLGAEFLAKFLPGTKVFLSNPTWCACATHSYLPKPYSCLLSAV